ncbi:MAG: 50S ribosomal protein L17 [Muribaculaceae bacterium]|nr:50S ribosomal protein L17 [Muribaculaceae bacterium]
MRHNKKFNHLGRKKAHREALLSNLTISLILHKRIFTTLAKAKALRMYCEPLINRSKKDDMQNRRLVFSYLQNKEAVKELFGVVAEKIADRPGGYTRILKTGHRLGDNAEMCMIELVDFNEAMLEGKGEKKAKATRRSRRKKAAPAEAPAAEAPAAE